MTNSTTNLTASDYDTYDDGETIRLVFYPGNSLESTVITATRELAAALMSELADTLARPGRR